MNFHEKSSTPHGGKADNVEILENSRKITESRHRPSSGCNFIIFKNEKTINDKTNK